MQKILFIIQNYSLLLKKGKFLISYKFLVKNFIKKNYLIAINKTKYRRRVEEMAKAESGKIRPVFSHLKNLIFLLITFAIYLNTPFLKLLKD